MALYEVLEDGTIVPKASGSNIYVKPDLEKEITISSGQSSIVIDDLVLSANEVYDIYLLCGTSSAVDCYLKLNDISSGYKYMLQRGYWYSGQEPNMTTKGSLNDSSFFIGTCWTVANSFHINLCNTGSGVVIDSRETGMDSTTNYVRDCSGAVDFSGNVTKLTFSLASGIFTSGRVLVYKRSKNKKPSMIYTGKELFAGNGINIENGVISKNNLVAEYTVPASAKSFTFGGLDILADGGMYQIEVYYPENTSQKPDNFHMRINGNADGGAYVHSFFSHEKETLNSGSQNSNNQPYIGTFGGYNHISIINLYLNRAGEVPFWEATNIGYTNHLYWEKFYGYTVSSSNITSLTFFNPTYSLGGMKIRVYRR